MPVNPLTLTNAHKSVLYTLSYHSIFSYPLTREELLRFAVDPALNEETIDGVLDALHAERLIFRIDGYYLATNDKNWVSRRKELNARADAFLPKARRMAAFIDHFPFVRAVFVSGSLSKDCMAIDGDIDFFIVTQPGRLWLSRTLLILFKKVFLFNSHKYFCINYLIDEHHLTIQDHNLFTATETLTLLPMVGKKTYLKFWSDNGWAHQFLPHCAARPTDDLPESRTPPVKKIMERLLSGYFAERMDSMAMNLTVYFWRRKFRDMDSATFERAFFSRKYISRHHPLLFQRSVMEKLRERVQENYPFLS